MWHSLLPMSNPSAFMALANHLPLDAPAITLQTAHRERTLYFIPAGGKLNSPLYYVHGNWLNIVLVRVVIATMKHHDSKLKRKVYLTSTSTLESIINGVRRRTQVGQESGGRK